jgi:RNA polymerase sigma factor (sigma-70 family)
MSATPAIPPGHAGTKTVSSEQLLAEFQRDGDASAFTTVVLRHLAAVRAVCRRTTGNDHDAEDAAQVVFLSLATHVRAGNSIDSVAAWLSQTARRAALDLVRSRSRRIRREQSRGPSIADSIVVPSPTHSLMDGEITGLLREEIGKLPARYRLPLILHYFGQMDTDEVSRELRCTRGALNVRLHRGRKLLSERLARRGITMMTGAVGIAVVDAVLTSLRASLKQEVAKTLATSAARAGFKPACAALTTQIMGIVRACALGCIAVLLVVGTSMADAPVLSRRLIPSIPSPRVIFDSALQRINDALGGLRRVFQPTLPTLRVSTNPSNPNGSGATASGSAATASREGSSNGAVIPVPPLAANVVTVFPAMPQQYVLPLRPNAEPGPAAWNYQLPPVVAKFIPMTDIPTPEPLARPTQSAHGFMPPSVATTSTLSGRRHHSAPTAPGYPIVDGTPGTVAAMSPIIPIPIDGPPADHALPPIPIDQMPLPNDPTPTPSDPGAPDTIPNTGVPEPATGLILLGAAKLLLSRRRLRRHG